MPGAMSASGCRRGYFWPAVLVRSRRVAGNLSAGQAKGRMRFHSIAVGRAMISRTRAARRVDVDDVLDRVAPLVRIRGLKGARGSKCALTSCGPKREVSHARATAGGAGRGGMLFKPVGGSIKKGA